MIYLSELNIKNNMKKLLIAFIAIISLNTINAQEEKIRFGEKLGLSISNVNFEDTDSFDSRIGFHIGALVEIPITDNFSIQPEIIYSTQGYKISETDFIDQTTKLNYLNTPLIAKFYIAKDFSLQLGPQIGFLLNATIALMILVSSMIFLI